MAFPAITNVDGVNTGPNYANPDTPQSPVGNLWKVGVFAITLSPSSVAANTTAEQNFAATGIGLFFANPLTDFVWVNKPTAQAGLGIVGARVSANDQLSITFSNNTASPIVPTASESYQVMVLRVQPNWTAPASGNQIDW